MLPTLNVTIINILFLLQAQYRYESQVTPLAASPAAVSPPAALPLYPLNPTEVPAPVGKRGGSLYPALTDFMGLDLSLQALAELAPEYALAIPQSVSTCYSVSVCIYVKFLCVHLYKTKFGAHFYPICHLFYF
jgi:hypothetical protein